MQFNNQARLLSLPLLNSVTCPVTAIKKMFKTHAGGKNSPLLQFRVSNTLQPLTDTRVRKHLKIF